MVLDLLGHVSDACTQCRRDVRPKVGLWLLTSVSYVYCVSSLSSTHCTHACMYVYRSTRCLVHGLFGAVQAAARRKAAASLWLGVTECRQVGRLPACETTERMFCCRECLTAFC